MWNKLTEEVVRRFHEGDKFDIYKLDDFIKLNGFTRYSLPGDQDFKRYLATGRSMRGYPHIIGESPPYVDHSRCFKNTKTGTTCLTYQPYEDPIKIETKIKQWAHEWELQTEIYEASYSWYYPGRTCLVILHLPGASIIIK